MGNFSWNCCDCGNQILSDGPDKEDYCFKCEEYLHEIDGAFQKVYLIETNGKLIEEEKYIGYGVFGGIDAYGWAAHRNIDAIREWKEMPELKLLVKDSYDVYGIKYAEDRGFGIDMDYDKKEKTFKEISEMVKKGITIGVHNLYHHYSDLVKYPIKIICESCVDGAKSVDYEDYGPSSSAENQGWSESSETEVGWICSGCYYG
tara:strand:+ start:188 stop:796 length:609 start_codon:yes stop_codon:yes gene_type:complete